MMSGRIQIFAKAPLAGRAKSRLIPALGAQGAAHLQALFIRHTLATTTQVPLPSELWCAPDIHHPVFAAAARDYFVYLYPQVGVELGERMGHAIHTGLVEGGAVVLIGTDCPTLAQEDLLQAFEALDDGHDAVLGPAADGGYYLIGLNRPQPQLFTAMPWSSAAVLDTTRARLHSEGLRWHELREQHDIDTPADLIHLPDSFRREIALELSS